MRSSSRGDQLICADLRHLFFACAAEGVPCVVAAGGFFLPAALDYFRRAAGRAAAHYTLCADPSIVVCWRAAAAGSSVACWVVL